jgi:hypothetical protein
MHPPPRANLLNAVPPNDINDERDNNQKKAHAKSARIRGRSTKPEGPSEIWSG